jgi:hypothetical protein
MKTLAKIVLAMILGVSLVHAAAFSKDVKHRTTKVHITADKPVTAGTNTFIFTITNKGKKIKDTQVDAKAFMPAMPGMPAMESKAKAEDLGNGTYKVTLNMAMSGTWQLHIFLTPKSGKKSRVKTTINF